MYTSGITIAPPLNLSSVDHEIFSLAHSRHSNFRRGFRCVLRGIPSQSTRDPASTGEQADPKTSTAAQRQAGYHRLDRTVATGDNLALGRSRGPLFSPFRGVFCALTRSDTAMASSGGQRNI